MAKKIDGFLLTLIGFVLVFVWSRFFIKDLIWSLLFAAAVCLFLVFCAKAVSKNIKNRPYSAERLANEFALRGNDYAASVLFSAFDNPDAVLEKNIIVCGKNMFFCCFKFSGISAGDVASAYQAALEKDAEFVVLLGRGFDRAALSLCADLPVKIKIVKISAVYRYLFKKKRAARARKEKDQIFAQVHSRNRAQAFQRQVLSFFGRYALFDFVFHAA